MIDTKEIRKALAIHGVDVLNVDEVLDVLDHLEAAYKEIESWKGLARQFGNEADELRTHLSFAKDELNRLRAKIAEMEKQEPAGIAGSMPGTSGFTMACFSADEVPMGTKLYALPGAQNGPNFADAYQGAMEEVAIWKKRALEAEDLNRKFIAEINGPMHMGEPAQPAPSISPVALRHVIQWLRNGCDPMKAADELEMLAAAPEAKP